MAYSSAAWLRAGAYSVFGATAILTLVSIKDMIKGKVEPTDDHRRNIVERLESVGKADHRLNTITFRNPNTFVTQFVKDKGFYRVDQGPAEVWISKEYQGVVLIERKH